MCNQPPIQTLGHPLVEPSLFLTVSHLHHLTQFGGQTPLKISTALQQALDENPIPTASGNGNVAIWGTQPDAIDEAEDRDRWVGVGAFGNTPGWCVGRFFNGFISSNMPGWGSSRVNFHPPPPTYFPQHLACTCPLLSLRHSHPPWFTHPPVPFYLQQVDGPVDAAGHQAASGRQRTQ